MSGYTHGVRLVSTPAAKRMANVEAPTPEDSPSRLDRSGDVGPTPCVKTDGSQARSSPAPRAKSSLTTHRRFIRTSSRPYAPAYGLRPSGAKPAPPRASDILTSAGYREHGGKNPPCAHLDGPVGTL